MNIITPKTLDLFVPEKTKQTAAWRIAAYNYYLGTSAKVSDIVDVNDIDNFLNNVVNDRDYSKFMNPYNFKDPRFKNLPGKLRNYDIVSPIYRRYIGEYCSSANMFHIVSYTPDEQNNYQKSLSDYYYKLVNNQVDAKLNKAGFDTGNPNASEVDLDQEIEQFKSTYKDAKVVNDVNLLNYVKASTKDKYLYGLLYSDWICYGCYFVDRYVLNKDVEKVRIIPNSVSYNSCGQEFVEDFESFHYEFILDLPNVLRMFPDLSNTEKEYLKATAGSGSMSGTKYVEMLTSMYIETVRHQIYNKEPNAPTFSKGIKIGKLYFKGFKEIAILKYIGADGKEYEMEVDVDYELNKEYNDISISYEYYPTIYEMYCIGATASGIFTVPKEIEIQRSKLDDKMSVKLPVTGKIKLGHSLPTHSIITILKPYQIITNILYLARERAVSKNYGKIAIIPKGLLGSSATSEEETLYYMYADGKLFLDTSNPAAANYINALKELNLSDAEYIRILGELIADVKQQAMDATDMNRQRFGDTYASDGKSVNEQALIRSSLGTAFMNYVFNVSRATDYNADIDFTKFAFIDGMKKNYVTQEGNDAFIEIDGLGHANTEYNVYCISDVSYNEKLKMLKDLAINTTNQNSNTKLAGDIIMNDDFNKISNILARFDDAQRKRQDALEAARNKSMEIVKQMELQKDAANNQVKTDSNIRDNQTKLIIASITKEIAAMKEAGNAADRETLSALETAKRLLQERTVNTVGR